MNRLSMNLQRPFAISTRRPHFAEAQPPLVAEHNYGSSASSELECEEGCFFQCFGTRLFRGPIGTRCATLLHRNEQEKRRLVGDSSPSRGRSHSFSDDGLYVGKALYSD